MTDPASNPRAALERLLPGVRNDLEDLVRLPSVSADPGSGPVVRRTAEATADLFRSVGAPEVEILQIDGGQPAVLARYSAPAGQPTVLLYAHHDVQPTGAPESWTSPPFEPVERDGRLYGRGVADDKAGIAAHLAALRAFEGQPPVGVTVLVEGEEEIGSPTLGSFLRTYRDRLAADVIVLADSSNLEAGTPALTTSLRGLADCMVEVRALDHGIHSGVYGGAVPDALTSLCRLLATLHDANGDVAITGLGTAPEPAVEYPLDRFRREAGMPDDVALIGSGPLASRLWSKPSCSVLAIDTTQIADASNTLIPAARAKVSVRLAPGDEARRGFEALRRHLEANAPWGVQVEVTEGDLGEPFALDPRGRTYDLSREALQEAWGTEPVHIGQGGSIPFVAEFAETFPEAAILVTSAGADPECRAHGPDESLSLEEFGRACLAETLLLAKLAH